MSAEHLPARTHEAGPSRLVAYDHGAHLATWELAGAPVVWCSEQAVLDGSKAIRGGVPVCFPWFADGPAGDLSPAHGVLRTATWHLDTATGDEVWAWTITDQDVVGSPGAEHVPGPFRVRYAVALGQEDDAPTLDLRLTVHNPGAAPLPVEVALHTYLGVADATTATVHGLSGAEALDKVTGRRGRVEGAVGFEGETDLVVDSPGSPAVEVRDGTRVLRVRSHGATQTVVWNPGAEKAAAMSDLGTQEWRDFVCVETAATAGLGLTLDPGATHTLGCTIAVHPAS
ncbi:D-hexose-6-phosphate mutarotase [Serinicoccus marinus]|uniref:D-hexose-6-phosphate mutarotase n=1 Tax=Serinicoccus marinus TaxID=247333 RepID=UPI002493CA71|nr:D-hexose-6-phosphate mutarotase [Serinicoccus marinus]